MSAIPAGANWFYASDSYTLNLSQSGTAPFIQYYQPGPANQSNYIYPGQAVTVYIKSCALVTLPVTADSAQGINTDFFVGLYDVTTAPSVWQNRMPFVAPYGVAANGVVMNQVSKLSNNTPRAFRDFGCDAPLVLGQTAPSTPGHVYQIGGAFQFNFGVSPILVQYEYYVHGAWTAV